MDNAYVREYGNLHVTRLTREMHERTCGYWYVVTSDAMAHIAFRTRDELAKWIVERRLQLRADLSTPGDSAKITGRYLSVMDRDRARFDALRPVLSTSVQDNGEWVPAKITETDGVRAVHFMNVNYRASRRGLRATGG